MCENRPDKVWDRPIDARYAPRRPASNQRRHALKCGGRRIDAPDVYGPRKP